MAMLEKEAAKKTLPARRKAMQNKKHMANAGILIDAAGAIMKAFKDYGFAGGIILSSLIATTKAMQMAQVNAQPLPSFAQGGDFVTSGPQMIQVGDNPGGRERVQVTPLSSPNIAGPQETHQVVNVNVSGNLMSSE